MTGKIHPVSMPKWGMEMTEGEIVEWHFSLGDQVEDGNDLLDIETAKIANTLCAHSAGVLSRILAEPGATFQVGDLLGVLVEGEVAEDEIDNFIASFTNEDRDVEDTDSKPVDAPKQTLSDTEEDSSTSGSLSIPASLAEGADDSHIAASAVARRLAEQYKVNLHNVEPSGHHGRVSKRDIEDAIAQAGGSVNRHLAAVQKNGALTKASLDDSALNASAVARRLAKQLHVNLHDCRASGHHGRICKADVEAAYALSGAGDLPNKQNQNLSFPSVRANAPAVEELAFSSMRKTIASRLQESKQVAPHFRTVIDVEMDDLQSARNELNKENPNAKISVNDMLIKACALALVQVPDVNIQFDGTSIKRFADADISVAVSLEEGLITPIVRKANRLDLIEISSTTKELAQRARANGLNSDEFVGGTFTISNLGMFGIKQFDAIINPPQAAILAVGATEARPVVIDGGLQFRQAITLTLSCDHRVIDGALAAKFLHALKECLHNPESLVARQRVS